MKSRKIYVILLFSLIVFQCVNNYVWLSKDCQPVGGGDSVFNLLDQLEFYNKLTHISSNVGMKAGMKNLLSQYLSLFSTPDCRTNTMYFIPSVANILFGRSLFVIRMTNLIYFIILIFAVYFIGKRLADKKTGLLAAFLVSFYPGIYGMSRQFEHDFPTTAMVALCICLLFYTEGFKSIRYSLFFGICLGFGVLFRGQTLFFLIGPLGFILYRTFLKNKQREFTRVFNLILSLSLVPLISSIWWRGNLSVLLRNFWDHVMAYYVSYTPSIRYVYDSYDEPIRFFTVKCFSFYLFNTITHISLSFFLIFIIGLLIFVKSKTIKQKFLILLWIIIPYIIFTVISGKFGRYYFPSFPAIALVSAAGILSLRWRIIKIPLVILILCIGMIQFFKLSYGLKGLPYLSVKLPMSSFCTHPRVNNHSQIMGDFAEIIKEKALEGQDNRVLVITEWGEPAIQFFLGLHLPNIQIFQATYGYAYIHSSHLNFNFLIVSSKLNSDRPDYELLRRKYEGWAVGEKKGLTIMELAEKETIIKGQIAFIDEMIERFKNYKILKKIPMSRGERYIFLTAKPPQY